MSQCNLTPRPADFLVFHVEMMEPASFESVILTFVMLYL